MRPEARMPSLCTHLFSNKETLRSIICLLVVVVVAVVVIVYIFLFYVYIYSIYNKIIA